MFNYFKNLFAPTVDSLVSDLVELTEKLEDVAKNKLREADEYQMLAALAKNEGVRATRIAAKLGNLVE